MGRYSFKVKLVIVVGALFGLSLMLLSSYTIYSVRSKSLKQTERELQTTLDKEVLKVTNIINRKFDLIRGISKTILIDVRRDRFDRATAVEILQTSLESHPDLLAIFAFTTRNGFDAKDDDFIGNKYFGSTGRFLPYIYRNANGELLSQPLAAADIIAYTAGLDTTSIERFIDPYFYKVGKDSILMVTGATPMHFGSHFGEVGFDYPIDFLQREMLKLKASILDGSAELAVVSSNGNFAANTKDPTSLGGNLSQYFEESKANSITKLSKPVHFSANDTLSIYIPVKFGQTEDVWKFVIELPKVAIRAETRGLLTTLLVASALILLLSLGLLYFFASRLSTPIVALATKTKVVESGDISFTIDLDRRDELGVLAKSFDAMVSKLREMIGAIRSGAENIATGSEQISASAQGISQGANQQAAATEEALAAIEEMLATIGQNSDNAQTAKQIAKLAAESIEDGRKTSQESISAMHKIAEKIIVISKIAEKTGMLAINASIEAARAGQYGKGFSTVASEVRKLAEESTLAANEIVDLTQESLKIAKESGEKLFETVPNVLKTSDLIEQIARSSTEQNESAAQIRMAMNELNEVTMQNTSTSEELATSSEELTVQTDLLKDTVAFFKVEKGEIDSEILDMEKNIEQLTSSLRALKEQKKQEENSSVLTKLEAREKDVKGVDLNLSEKTDDDFEKH